MGLLNGKTALITGASRGIGFAIAKRFAAEGASVVLCASRLGAHGKLLGTLESAVNDINTGGGRAAAEVCDLRDVTSRADLIQRAAKHFGEIDILVNNAAASKMLPPSLVTTAQRNMMFDLNVNVPIELSQQALLGMRERGRGWILNVGSSTANQPIPPYRDSPEAAHAICAYGATKSALNRYTQGLAHELAGSGVFINGLAPENIVLTSGADYVRDIALKNPDMVEPIEMMAEAALALCTGQHVGQICYSRQLVHSLGLDVKSLDGNTVLGNAFLVADLKSST